MDLRIIPITVVPVLIRILINIRIRIPIRMRLCIRISRLTLLLPSLPAIPSSGRYERVAIHDDMKGLVFDSIQCISIFRVLLSISHPAARDTICDSISVFSRLALHLERCLIHILLFSFSGV